MNDEMIFKAVSDKVTAFCDKNILNKCDRLVAGVSGGADSLSMLLLLVKYCKNNNIKLVCAHFNHQIRGEEADADQLFVENVCKKLDVEYKSRSMDVISYGKEHGISSEMAGRELRYSFFRELAGEHGLIAVAHTKNDKIETIMLNIARGSGTKGLSGIVSVNGQIVRPVIDLSRQETEFVCRYFGYEYRIDSTNCENEYKRNVVRNIVMPNLEENFPGFGEKLLSLSEIAAEENEFIDEIASRNFNDIVIIAEENNIIISKTEFAKQHIVIQKRIIRMCAEKLRYDGQYVFPGLCGFEKTDAERAVDFILKGETGKIIKLHKNVKLEISYDLCKMYYKKPEIQENKQEITLNLSEIQENIQYEYEIGGCNFTIIKTQDYGKFMGKSKDSAVFDFEKITALGSLISLRNMEPEDYFVPFGAEGGKMLRRFLTDQKVPKEKRIKLVFAAIGKNVLFLPGIRRSDIGKVEKNTNCAIIIKCFHLLTED